MVKGRQRRKFLPGLLVIAGPALHEVLKGLQPLVTYMFRAGNSIFHTSLLVLSAAFAVHKFVITPHCIWKGQKFDVSFTPAIT